MKAKLLLCALNPVTSIPALSIAFLATYVRNDPELEEAVSIETLQQYIYDLTEDRIQSLVRHVVDERFETVAFSAYVWNMLIIRDLSRRLREQVPGVRIIIGGPEALDAEYAFRAVPEANYVVLGEGEIPFVRLLRALFLHDGDEGAIPGVAYRSNGHVRLGPSTNGSNLVDIKSMLSPYLTGTMAVDPSLNHPILLSRGCPMHCAFCIWGLGSRTFRYRELADIKREIDFIVGKGGRQIMILDSMFASSKKTVKEIIRYLGEHRLDLAINATTDVEMLDSEVIDLLVESPLQFLEVGLQSTNPKALELMGRRWNRERWEKEFFEIRDHPKRKFGIFLDLIYGLPGDDLETFRDSFNYAYGIGVDRIEIFRLQVLPGTSFWQRASELGLKYESDPPHRVVNTPTWSEEDLDLMDAILFTSSMLYKGDYQRFLQWMMDEVGLSAFDVLREFAETLGHLAPISGGIARKSPQPGRVGVEAAARWDEASRVYRGILGLGHLKFYYRRRLRERPDLLRQADAKWNELRDAIERGGTANA